MNLYEGHPLADTWIMALKYHGASSCSGSCDEIKHDLFSDSATFTHKIDIVPCSEIARY